jgi:hypothetical protein
MNALITEQGTGIQWRGEIPDQLYGDTQEGSHFPEPRRGSQLLNEIERQMAEYAGDFNASVDEVRKYYLFPSDSSVQSFLIEHSSATQQLLDAIPHLARCFGPSTIVRLRAPIDEGGIQMLYASVVWPGPARDVRDALARFDDDWWMAQVPLTSGDLTFTYELV